MRAALALVAALALLAGCGSSTDKSAAYKDDVKKVANEFKASLAKTGTQVKSGTSLKARAPALVSFKASVDRFATGLARLNPPSSLKKLNDQTVRQLGTLSSDLSAFVAAAKAGDTKKAQQLVPTLQADQAVLQKTLDELERDVNK
jgi:thiamine biosynthesis lipoprotein ApbE